MITALDLADLAPWKIYTHNRHWPSQPEMVFLPSIVTDAMWVRHGIPGCHAVEEDETRTYRDFVAADFAELILKDSLKLTCVPVSGGRWRTLTALDLTPQVVQLAIATGTIVLGTRKRETRNWVFCGVSEARLLISLLQHEAGNGDDTALLARLIALARRNLSRVAGYAPASSDSPGPHRVLSLLLPTLAPTMGPDDRIKVIGAAAEWLTAQFTTETTRLLKKGYRDLALETFAPVLTSRMFDQAWAKAATSKQTAPGRRPADRP